MAVDLLWNVLAISPRVITLALFASYQLYWFWGLVIGQIVVVTVIFLFYAFCADQSKDNVLGLIVSSFCLSVGMIFNMAVAGQMKFYVYILYWFVTMIENTVLISLWFVWSSDLGLWYHDVAIGCIISSYLLSFVIEFSHSYFYNDRQCDVLQWYFLND